MVGDNDGSDDNSDDDDDDDDDDMSELDDDEEEAVIYKIAGPIGIICESVDPKEIVVAIANET